MALLSSEKLKQSIKMKAIFVCATIACIFIVIHSAAVPAENAKKQGSSDSSEEMTTTATTASNRQSK